MWVSFENMVWFMVPTVVFQNLKGFSLKRWSPVFRNILAKRNRLNNLWILVLKHINRSIRDLIEIIFIPNV
jgi:hypothetical protein